VGHRALIVGRQSFLNVLKIIISDKIFIKIIKSQHYDLQKHLETKIELILTQLKAYNKQKMFKRFMEGRKMFIISL